MRDYPGVLAANTSAYAGYDLVTAVERIAALGYRRIEIASMAGLVEHISQDRLTVSHARWVSNLLKDHGLQSKAFSGHLFLCEDDAVERFLPRMDFAKEIGAEIINTKAGSPERRGQFLRNMEVLVRHAEEIDISIGLETHGDIVEFGPDAVDVVRQFETRRVLLNYDFGNVLINSQGIIDPAEDFARIVSDVGHLHLKDAVLNERVWTMCPVGEGTIDYKRVFVALRSTPGTVPMTVDLPLGLTIGNDGRVEVLKEPLSLETIDKIMLRSFRYVSTFGEIQEQSQAI